MFLKWVSRLFIGLMLTLSGAHADPIVTGSKPYTFIPGTTISSSQVNADFDYIINQVNTNAAKNGVNSSITALLGLTTPIAPSFGGSPIYTSGTAGGTANAITVSVTQPAVSSYSLTTGNFVLFVGGILNTGTTTLDVNSTGAVNITKISTSGLVSLQGGDIIVGGVYLTYYNGTSYVLLNTPQLFGASTAVASAATVDLGLVQSRNASITGTTTITSFGSAGSTAVPLYYVRFTGALTLTYNATSLITPGGTNILTAAGDTAWVEYLGSGNWRINSYTPAVNVPQLESVNAFTMFNNAATPTTQLDLAAASAVLCNTTAYCVRTGTVSLTINAGTTGANGLDTGSLVNNTWYHAYLISNGTTTAGLLSTSATAPTMPSGYVYKYRVGAVRTLGAATFVRIRQTGNKTSYIVVTGSTTPNLPQMASGTAGNTGTTWASVATGDYVPPTAVIIAGGINMSNASSGATVIFAPNNSYGFYASTANPPVASLGATGSAEAVNMPWEVTLESTNVFWASGASTGRLTVRGWTDSVNAN